MKKIILAVTLLALAGGQMQTANAYWGHGGYGWGRGGWGWGVGVGVLGGLAVGTAIGEAYARPVYYNSYYDYGRPYYYGAPYYYPPTASGYYPATAAPTAQSAAPQNITINNNYYNTSTPMSGANSLFGR